MKNSRNLILGEVVYIVSQILDFIHWMVKIFSLNQFWSLDWWKPRIDDITASIALLPETWLSPCIRCCVTTVSIYKGLYGNATVLLEKSILLIFCEKKSTYPVAVLYSSGNLERSVSVFSDRNIRDHLWRWSTISVGIFQPKFAVPLLTTGSLP